MTLAVFFLKVFHRTFLCVSLEPGVWLLASLNSHETTKGMRVKFQDVECYRDYTYEYSDYEDSATNKEFNVWKPQSLEELKKKEEKPKPTEEKKAELDFYTQMFANELGLRSLKNHSRSSDVEQLDLSFLNYDTIDVPDVLGDVNITINFLETKGNNETSIPKSNGLHETSLPKWKEVDGLNLTAVNLRTQSFSENATHMPNNSTSSTFDNSSLYETENTTVLHILIMLLKNNSRATNSSASSGVSNLDNVAVSDTNATVHNGAALSMVGNDSTNLMVTIQGNSSSTSEPERNNAMLTGDNRTSVDVDSEERLTRGDVFFYPLPPSNESTITLQSASEGNVTSLSHIREQAVENNTATSHAKQPADGINASLSTPKANVGVGDISSIDRRNHTIFELEVGSTDNNDSLIITPESDLGLHMNSSEIVTVSSNSSVKNKTNTRLEASPIGNVTVNISKSNSPGEISLEGRENVTAPLVELTSSVKSFSNDTLVSSNRSLSSNAVGMSSSEELSASGSSEEVFIYLKQNKTDSIKTSSVKMQGHTWTYEGTHQTVPMGIPDFMMKYFGKEAPPTAPTTPKKRKVNLRQRPQKGQGMKTKKRKEYKPQSRSGLPFSPRGFNPGMTPRGSRPQAPQPVTNEENLINMPVVIGVPRPDFSDYELYIPGNEPDHLELDEQDVKADEYEYVSFKDPYSSHEDVKNFNLDETTKYHLKYSGPNVNTYFIAAEEVEWDYAGYGQR